MQSKNYRNMIDEKRRTGRRRSDRDRSKRKDERKDGRDELHRRLQCGGGAGSRRRGERMVGAERAQGLAAAGLYRLRYIKCDSMSRSFLPLAGTNLPARAPIETQSAPEDRPPPTGNLASTRDMCRLEQLIQRDQELPGTIPESEHFGGSVRKTPFQLIAIQLVA